MGVKQTIQLEFKNAPTGTPLAGRSATSSLTSDQSCSVTEEAVLYLPEEDQQRVNSEQDLRVPVVQMTRVFVLSNKNESLMPCSPRKARVLLKEGKAVVVSARPFFTIKLKHNTGGCKQPITLGIDPGYEYMGFALVSDQTCYMVGHVKLDTKMSQRLTARRMFRRVRRNRLRYRPSRWCNRASSRRRDLSPSVQRRLERHCKLIDKLDSICPITEIRIERVKFDIQQLNNPSISGKGYQEGLLYKSNLRAYLFARENGICQYCGKKIKKGESINMHHIRFRSQGGTDKPDNMALLHEKCHRKIHETQDFGKLKKNKQYKAETFMNTINKRLFERYSDAIETFGYITQVKRKEIELPKEHYIDAFVIAGGTTQAIPKPLKLQERRKNNRSLQVQHEGKPPAIRRKRYPIQPGDLIWLGKKRFVSKGSCDFGKRCVILQNDKRKYINVSKITKTYHFGTLGFEE